MELSLPSERAGDSPGDSALMPNKEQVKDLVSEPEEEKAAGL